MTRLAREKLLGQIKHSKVAQNSAPGSKSKSSEINGLARNSSVHVGASGHRGGGSGFAVKSFEEVMRDKRRAQAQAQAEKGKLGR
jgi:hypothetical protein